MRALRLQMQISLDGFVSGPNGEMDWMEWDWDDDLNDYVATFTESVDNILLGRKLAEAFIPYWSNAARTPQHPEHRFASRMDDTSKTVFSKKLHEAPWPNTKIAHGNLADEINKLKKQKGKDIIVYGGAGFVSSLVKLGLIDDYQLLVNPVAIGKGLTIFGELENNLHLQLVGSRSFECGIVALRYKPW